jgi:hypothetical protein
MGNQIAHDLGFTTDFIQYFGLRLVKLSKAINSDTFHDRVIPILIPCWCYWIPLQACIYALPPDLQYPFAMTCVSAWSLVLVFIAKRMDRRRLPRGCSVVEL